MSKDDVAAEKPLETGAGTSSKRNRSINNSTVVDAKKQRMAVSYRDVAKESLIMLIKCDKGALDTDQAEAIRVHLYSSVDALPDDIVPPQIQSNKLIDGVHVFECENAYSFDWLSECLRNFVCPGGLNLCFNSKAQEVPKRKVLVYLPDKKEIDIQLLFKRTEHR